MMKLIVLKDTFSKDNLDVLNAKDDCILEIKKSLHIFQIYLHE